MKQDRKTKGIALRVGNFPVISETFIVEQAKLIVELGFDLLIVVNHKNEYSTISQRDVIEKYKLLQRTVELKNYWRKTGLKRGVKIFQLIFFNFNYRAFGLLNPFKFGIKALSGGAFLDYHDLKILNNYPVVHVEFGYSITSLDRMKALGLLKSKLIVTFHGADAHFNSETKDQKKMYYDLLFKVGDYFTCNTEYLRNQLLQLGCPEDKLEVVHVPVDTEKFKPLKNKRESSDTIKLLSVGRLVKWKGHHLGIEVVNILRSKGLKVEYRIVGEGSEYNKLEKLISAHGLNNEVRLLGKLSQEEVLENMQKCDLFLMTSTSDDSGRRETQGVVTIEAQACGKPAIGFNSGGTKYTILDGESGFLCEEGNVHMMADKVQRLIEDPELRHIMGKRAIDFIGNNFSNRVISKKWSRIYDELLNN